MADARLPTIPQYYKRFVDAKVDLDSFPSQPCPFHHEKQGKSFSYSRDLKIWRCFGQCHCGGDVIDLHRLNYRMSSREEAKKSLYQILQIPMELDLSFEEKKVEADPEDVHRRRMYALALSLAKEPKDWIELDYIMSKVPYDVGDLEMFCIARGQTVTSSNTITLLEE